jgi:hypothetical protein
MILNRNLEINFIKNIQKKHSPLTIEEQMKLLERNNKVNSKFELNVINSNRLLFLNKKLFDEEKRMFSLYKNIEAQCKELVKNQLIDDFELEITLECWNKNYYKNFDSDLEGNPFYEISCDFMNFQDDIIYKKLDFYEFKANLPIQKTEHCYTFHHLYDHTILTFFDLCNIDEIWMELKVIQQNYTNIK